MDLLLPGLIIAAIAMKRKNGVADSAGDGFNTVTPPGVTLPKPGEPQLKVDKVKKLLNKVDFSFSDGDQKQEFTHKWKGGKLTSGIVGKWKVEALTTMEPDPKRPGKMQEGAVMVYAKEAGKQPKFVKRVLVNEGVVIDVR